MIHTRSRTSSYSQSTVYFGKRRNARAGVLTSPNRPTLAVRGAFGFSVASGRTSSIGFLATWRVDVQTHCNLHG